MPVTNNSVQVDAAGFGRRNLPLPGEIFHHLVWRKKSAEVIVAVETSRDCEHHTPEDSQNSEGLNIELCPNSDRNHG